MKLLRANETMTQPSAISAGRLPVVSCVGFTGSVHAENEAQARDALRAFLKKQQTTRQNVVCGVASLCGSADLLFAECCLELDVSVRLLLPLNHARCRADFSPADQQRAERVLREVLSTELVSVDERQEEQIYECGLQTVQQSETLLALWDGEPAKELGAPANIVNFAARLGRPVFWIHSETGASETLHENRHAANGDAELMFFNSLPALVEHSLESVPQSATESWVRKLDGNATAVAPQVRRMAAIPIMCTALAAFITGAAERLHASGVLASVGVVLGLVAAVSPAALRIGKRQALWVRIRTAAEISRSFLALWGTPGRYQIVSPEILPELSGMLTSLNHLKAQGALTDAHTVESFKAAYIRDRVQDQRAYFLRQTRKSREQGNRYRWIGSVASAIAIAMAAWTFVSHSLLKWATGGAWFPLASSALFQVATVVGALVVVHDCDRRARRYDQLSQSLERWEVELEAFHTWQPVMEVVTRVERALLAELLEWRSLLQSMKMPRH